MTGLILALTTALLPYPQQYDEIRGFLRLKSAAEEAATVCMVDSIPGAGSHQDEAYQLTVSRKGIEIKAVTPMGELRAKQTLRQLESQGHRRTKVKCCSITDWAAFPYRGFLQDIGRSYLSIDEIKNEIGALSAFKMNVFHWHLTENQAWRLESRKYPELNAPENMTRFPGKYYSVEEVRDVLSFAASVGVDVIPEIDMPGHSAAFVRTFGVDMQSKEGMEILKDLISEAAETFKGCRYFHIGTDEVRISNPSFAHEMAQFVKGLGFKVASWMPGSDYDPQDIDLLQLWSYRGKAQPGILAVDSKLHYLNHFDPFADVMIMHGFKPCGLDETDGQTVGSEVAIWHDQFVSTEDRMVRENILYPAAMTIAERTWRGGEAGPFDEFEERMLHYINSDLKGFPVTYVRQNNVHWGITEAFPNEGDLTAVFPPETEDPSAYQAGTATGAGVYLRHVWGGICPQFFEDPQPNSTVYAWTWVWSPKSQDAGILMQFQIYSRSEKNAHPEQGKWDYRGSRAWLNDEEILPPVWEDDNENLTGRAPVQTRLKRGWNKVLLKLPVGEFSTPEVRLVSWMYDFVLTTPEGTEALPGLIYSPDKSKRGL